MTEFNPGDKVTHFASEAIFEIVAKRGDYVWLMGPWSAEGLLAPVSHIEKFEKPIEPGDTVKFRNDNWSGDRYIVVALFEGKAWIRRESNNFPFTEPVKNLEAV